MEEQAIEVIINWEAVWQFAKPFLIGALLMLVIGIVVVCKAVGGVWR